MQKEITLDRLLTGLLFDQFQNLCFHVAFVPLDKKIENSRERAGESQKADGKMKEEEWKLIEVREGENRGEEEKRGREFKRQKWKGRRMKMSSRDRNWVE